MLKEIFFAILLIFAVTGFITLSVFFLIRLLKISRKENISLVLAFDEASENSDVTVSLCQSLLCLFGISGRVKIIAADKGMKKEDRIRLQTAFGRQKQVKICSSEEISQNI